MRASRRPAPPRVVCFEWGTIDFGRSGLRFSSIGAGTMLGPPGADGFSHGAVLWRVDSGWGALDGATGAIASNFLVALDTEELVDCQYHVLELPRSAAVQPENG